MPIDADRPLETGMVASLPATLEHPQRGLIKLEDTVVMLLTGFEVDGRRPHSRVEQSPAGERRSQRIGWQRGVEALACSRPGCGGAAAKVGCGVVRLLLVRKYIEFAA